MITCKEMEEEEGDDKQSMLRLLFMGKDLDEQDKSSCTPNSLTPLGRIPDLLLVQVLEL